MAIYDYRCSTCQHCFEKHVSGPRCRVNCPQCGAPKTARLPALVGIRERSSTAPMLAPPTGPNGAHSCCFRDHTSH